MTTGSVKRLWPLYGEGDAQTLILRQIFLGRPDPPLPHMCAFAPEKSKAVDMALDMQEFESVETRFSDRRNPQSLPNQLGNQRVFLDRVGDSNNVCLSMKCFSRLRTLRCIR